MEPGERKLVDPKQAYIKAVDKAASRRCSSARRQSRRRSSRADAASRDTTRTGRHDTDHHEAPRLERFDFAVARERAG